MPSSVSSTPGGKGRPTKSSERLATKEVVTMKILSFLAGSLILLSLAVLPKSYGATSDAQLGMPPPGTASDQEDTKKQRDPAKAHRMDETSQVTIGGAKPVVSGHITKIQEQFFFVKDAESGEEVRLLVNKDTNMDCGGASGRTGQEGLSGSGQGSEQQSAGATSRQREQGQRQNETAVGSGFKLGSCAFHDGDMIKAEVDDNGRVTTLKFMSEDRTKEPQTARSGQFGASGQTGDIAMPGRQDKPGQLDMTGAKGKEYAVLPVPLGEFKVAGRSPLLQRPVTNPQGKQIGKVESLIMDSNTGQIEYAVISTPDGATGLQAVPWAHFWIKRDGQDDHLVLNTKQFQLNPDTTSKEAANVAPEIQKLLKDKRFDPKAPADLRDDMPSGQRSGSEPPAITENQGQGTGRDRRTEAMREVQGDIIRGRISKIDGDSLSIMEKGGREISAQMDRNTMIGARQLRDDPFKEGDQVEAYVTPDGHVFSISQWRAAGHMGDDPDNSG
jgi:sporulation protein YlmC with PRC-barrel domain